jgi:hypothetical protein
MAFREKVGDVLAAGQSEFAGGHWWRKISKPAASPTACEGRLPISLVISAARSVARSVNSSAIRFTIATRSLTGHSLHAANASVAAGECLRHFRVRCKVESLGHLAGRRIGHLIGRALCHTFSRYHRNKGPV